MPPTTTGTARPFEATTAYPQKNAGRVPGIPTRTRNAPAPESVTASRRAWLPSHRVSGNYALDVLERAHVHPSRAVFHASGPIHARKYTASAHEKNP